MTTQERPAPESVSDDAEVNVQKLHAPIIREHQEPKDGFEPLPFLMLVLFAGLLLWGGWYLGKYSADFDPNALDRGDPKSVVIKADEIPRDEEGLRRLGERKYNAICVTCHQASGEGDGKQFPPLNGSEWVVGAKSSPARLARILLYGIGGEVEVRGKMYSGAMPAQGAKSGGTMKDHEIAAVLTYIRSSWTNKAPAIWPEDITAARKRVGNRSTAMTAKELEALVEYVDPEGKSTLPTTTTPQP